MKHIIYLLDGFSPTYLKRYKKKKIKFNSNYLDILSKDSIFFNNAYGYGETYSTTYGMFTGKDIYKNYCDAWDIPFSFKEKSSLAKNYKNKGYETIYYRNAAPNAELRGFYGRYLKSVTGDFDFKNFKKQNHKDNLEKFLRNKELSEKLFSKKNFFIYIHDFTLHDDKRAYTGTIKNYQEAVSSASFTVKKNLKLINYNRKTDLLFFLSDHGLTPYPQSQTHFKKLDSDIFNKYYPYLFKDEKIKFTFFIKVPENISFNINNKIIPSDVFKIINKLSKDKKFIKRALILFFNKVAKKKIVITLKDVSRPIYGNYFIRKLFHTHLVFIESKKQIFSKDYPNEFGQESKNKFKIINKSEFSNANLNFIKDYYSKKNFFKKLFFIFFLYYPFTKVYSVLKNRIMRVLKL